MHSIGNTEDRFTRIPAHIISFILFLLASTKTRRYYLHLITTPKYGISLKSNEHLKIKLKGQQSKTVYRNALQIGESYYERGFYRKIFRFEAEDIEKVITFFIR